MTVQLPTKHHLEFLSLKGGWAALSDTTLVKCHIVENHMSLLICAYQLQDLVGVNNALYSYNPSASYVIEYTSLLITQIPGLRCYVMFCFKASTKHNAEEDPKNNYGSCP